PSCLSSTFPPRHQEDTVRRTTGRLAALLVGSALAFSLAACAQGDPGDEGETDNGWPDEIVLGLVPSQDVDQLVLDAEELGTMLSEELGVDVTTTVTDSYNALVVAMQAE